MHGSANFSFIYKKIPLKSRIIGTGGSGCLSFQLPAVGSNLSAAVCWGVGGQSLIYNPLCLLRTKGARAPRGRVRRRDSLRASRRVPVTNAQKAEPAVPWS